MQQQLLTAVCQLSGTAVFEYVDDGAFRIIGDAPEWTDSVEAIQSNDEARLSTIFPQLITVQADLDAYWLSSEKEILDLGIWELPTDSDFFVLRLRAFGTRADEKRIFVLQGLDQGLFDTPMILQKVRERELQADEQILRQNRQLERMQEDKLSAEKRSEMKNLFVADVSHEIRAPLNIIVCMLALAKKTCPESADGGLLESAISASRNLARICLDLIDVSKIDAGRVEIVSQDLSLKKISSEICESFQSAAKRKGIALKFDVDEKIPSTVRGDEVRITQVLTNLVSNAVKFTEHGAVELSIQLMQDGTRQDGTQRIKFSVTDTGIGIPSDKIGAIFDEFVQINPQINSSRQGSGLGLGIARSLVGLMGSEILVASQENQGSEFSFTLEFDDQVVRQQQVANEQGLANRLDSNEEDTEVGETDSHAVFKVLVAEEHPVNLKLVGEILASSGFDVTPVGSGVEALSALQTTKYDVTILDFKLPTINGIDVIRAIRKSNGLNKAIRAIATTSFGREIDRKKCLGAGFDVCLDKPLHLEHLVATVKSLAEVG